MENEATERPRGRRAARHSIGAAQHWRGRRGAAWLCAASATFSYPAGYGRGTNGRSVSAVNRKRVLGLLLSTPARFFHAVVGVGGVSLGQRGRHEERAGDDGEHLGLVRGCQFLRLAATGRHARRMHKVDKKCALNAVTTSGGMVANTL